MFGWTSSLQAPRKRSLLQQKALAFVTALGLFAALPWGARADDPNAKSAALLQSANSALRTFLVNPQWEALRNLLGGARAVYIVPHDIAGGFLITASGGDGVLLRRHGQVWSDPLFMHIGSVGLGFQAGGETQSLVMVIMTDTGVDNLISGVSQIGGGGGFALANLGVGGGGSGGVSGGLQVLTVSAAQGLFAGGGIQGTQMSPEVAYNQANYGPGYSMTTIAAGYGGKVSAASALRAYLSQAVIESWGK
jgi:lipid-binding SYLF domain-containing protein